MECNNPFSLEGKQILVTGASSGIGKAIALACAKMGANVFITGRSQERLEATFSLLPEGKHRLLPADLTKPDDIDVLTNNLPILDGLVHCAGVGSRVPCRSINKAAIDNVMAPNFDAPVLLQSALLSNKKIRKQSSIVFIASRAASFPSIGNAIYSASKGALISYAKCLALELAPRNIRVNCICPGMVWTELISSTLDENELKLAEEKYPLKRFGNVDDIANLSIFLLSDASAWMTGTTVDISGGGEGILV